MNNPVPQNYNKYYKRQTQGKIVDYVIVMGYDEHYSGGEEVGSVASLPFVEDTDDVRDLEPCFPAPSYSRLYGWRCSNKVSHVFELATCYSSSWKCHHSTCPIFVSF